MACKQVRPLGGGVQDRRSMSRTRPETADTLARSRGALEGATVYPAHQPACHTSGMPSATKTALKVGVEQQKVLPNTKHGKGGSKKPRSSDLERRIREARRSHDPCVDIERICYEQGYPEGWFEQIAGLCGILPP